MTPIKQVVWCSWLYTNNMTNNISCIYTKFWQQTTHPSNYQSKFFPWIDIHYKAPNIARASFEFFWVHTFGFAKHQKNYNIENTHTHTHIWLHKTLTKLQHKRYTHITYPMKDFSNNPFIHPFNWKVSLGFYVFHYIAPNIARACPHYLRYPHLVASQKHWKNCNIRRHTNKTKGVSHFGLAIYIKKVF